MRSFHLVLLLTLLPAAASPQTASATGPLTLEQVLTLAEMCSEAIGIARTAITRSQADAIRARSGLYPQVTGTAPYERALASEFSGVFDNVNLGSPRTSGDDASEDGGGLANLPFGRANTWRVSLSFSQNLFPAGESARNASSRRSAGKLPISASRPRGPNCLT